MLIGFFKKPEECDANCNIIKFSDRIWLDEYGKGFFWRTFIVQVNENSSQELSSIKMLIPIRNILELKNINTTCFNQNYYWNSPHLNTGANYNIKKLPKKDGSYNDYGIIDHDQIKNILVFTNIDQSSAKFTFDKPLALNQATLLSWDFPKALSPGEKLEIRITFEVTSLFDITNPGTPCPDCALIFTYFNYNLYPKEIEILSKDNEIKVKPIFNETTRAGGFDILLSFPPKFSSVHGFDNIFKSTTEYYNPDGSKGEIKQKYIWRLRKFWPPGKLVGIGDELIIEGVIRREFPTEQILKEIANGISTKVPGQITNLKNQISSVNQIQQQQSHETIKIKKRLTAGNILSIIAIALSVGIPIVAFVIDYLAK